MCANKMLEIMSGWKNGYMKKRTNEWTNEKDVSEKNKCCML